MRWILAAAFVVAWSSGFVGATLADRTGVGVWPLLAWRYLATALLLVVACAVVPSARQAVRTLQPRDLAQQGVLGVLSHVVFLGGVFLAAGAGLDAGLSALICALQPMLVAAVSRPLFGDRLTKSQWVGMLLALGGVALSVGGVGAGAVGAVGLVVASLFGLSGAALLERAWAPKVPVLVSLTLQVVLAASVFGAAAALTHGLAVTVTPTLLAAIAWLVLLSGLGGYAAFIGCLRRLGSTTTSTLLYLTAPVTTLWAWAMFTQAPTPVQWAGLTVVLTGVTLAMRRPQARP